jgi:predicted HicB family RNase H-like nuclease
MQHKGYIAKVEYDDSVGYFHGSVQNTRDVITFEGKTGEELQHEFAASIADYEDMCKKAGVEPEKPYSGKFVVRVKPELHARLAAGAALRDESLNDLVNDALERCAAELQEA